MIKNLKLLNNSPLQLKLPFFKYCKIFIFFLIISISTKPTMAAKNLPNINLKPNQKTDQKLFNKNQLINHDAINKINTKGHYLTLDFISSKANYDEFFQTKKEDYVDVKNYNIYGYTGLKSPDKTANSLGIRYGYAFNYHDFFLMPEIFYDRINLKTKLYPDQTMENFKPEVDYDKIKTYEDVINNEIRDYDESMLGFKSLQIHKIYGLKLNFGYDINSFFSAYVSGGLGRIDHSIKSGIYTKNFIIKKNINFNFDPNPQIRRYSTRPFFGFGLKVKLNDNLNVISEYQRYNLKSPTATFNAHNKIYSPYGSFIDAKLIIARIGLSYNF